VGGLQLSVVQTPGHTADSLTFHLPADGALLTGDTILGRGSAVIAHPDGHLKSYLASLDRLSALAQATGAGWVLPGHGPASPHPAELISAYQQHRRERLEAVAAALRSGTTDTEELLAVTYPDVPEELRWAARLSLAAQVEYLVEGAEALPAG
jgi:glyoxylase-like metal-dependent hydrolase (beta-lactamase superfamily II)